MSKSDIDQFWQRHSQSQRLNELVSVSAAILAVSEPMDVKGETKDTDQERSPQRSHLPVKMLESKY